MDLNQTIRSTGIPCTAANKSAVPQVQSSDGLNRVSCLSSGNSAARLGIRLMVDMAGGHALSAVKAVLAVSMFVSIQLLVSQ